MHDAGKVITGLAIFLALVLSPVWYQAARGAETGPPELERAIDGPDCVAEIEYMRSLHMELLDVWRDEAVREVPSHLALLGVADEPEPGAVSAPPAAPAASRPAARPASRFRRRSRAIAASRSRTSA